MGKYYGEYPFFNMGKDCDAERLRWLYSRTDNGEFYFKSIVKNIIDKFNFKPQEIIQKIKEKKRKVEE